MNEVARVKSETVSFNALMLNISEGKIRIPDFQREFAFLDSIYSHLPIGSPLFWETDDGIQALAPSRRSRTVAWHIPCYEFASDGLASSR